MQQIGRIVDLVAPLKWDDFLARSWRREGVHVPSQDSRRLEELFKTSNIDDVLCLAASDVGQFDFYMAGEAVERSSFTLTGGQAALNALLGLYSSQCGTIHVSNIQRFHRRLNAFCNRARFELGVDCEADLWMTRHNAHEPYLHFDRYDIFVLQIHGSKRWRIFDVDRSLRARNEARLDWGDVGDPVLDVIIRPGECVYLPPFAPHVVTTVEGSSVHVGIGLHPPTWGEMVERIVGAAGMDDELLGEFLPLSVTQLSTLVDGALPTAMSGVFAAVAGRTSGVADLVNESLLERTAAPFDEHVTRQVLDAPPIEMDTRMLLRTGVRGYCKLDSMGRAVVRYSGGGQLRGPASLMPVMEFILSTERSFSVADLPPVSKPDTLLSLLRKAVESGLCVRVS